MSWFMATSQVLFGQGDFDYDGDVDNKDFMVFSNNYGKPFFLQTKQTPFVDTLVVVKTDTVTITKTVQFGGREPLLRAAHLLGYWILHIQKKPGPWDPTRTYPICFNTISDVQPDGEYWISGKPLSNYYSNIPSSYSSVDVAHDFHIKWTTGPFKVNQEYNGTYYPLRPYHFAPPPHGYYRLITKGPRGFSDNTEIIFLIEYKDRFFSIYSEGRIAEPSVKILGIRCYNKKGGTMDSRMFDSGKSYLRQVSQKEYFELCKQQHPYMWNF